MQYYDLRSDTVTLPDKKMREIMHEAPLGDDVFGEDPSINKLEEYAAHLFGMEAALYCASGTMSNQIAIKTHTNPPGELICHELAHIFQYEGGGIAFNSGLMPKCIRGNRGRITVADIIPLVNPDDVHKSETQLVCVENTCNKGGGSIYDFNELKNIGAFCKKENLKFHLDGARLFNAIIETKETPKDYGQLFDSISICLSKGLGAPVGSILLGNAAFIKKARRIRKLLGGGMRQAGMLAAAGLYALQNNVEKLKDDHKKARMLGEAIGHKDFVEKLLPIESNIVVFYLKAEMNVSVFLSDLEQKGVLAVPFGGQAVRFIPNLNQSVEDIEKVCEILKSL